jgi:hypothetical protein
MTIIDIDQHLIDELAETPEVVADPAAVLVEPWPYPPGPEGPLQLANGSVAHGAYALVVGDHLELVVANNGWPIEHRRCPGPLPPPTPYARPSNPWLSQQPTLSHLDGHEITVDPNLAVLSRVGQGAKAIGLADVDTQGEADAAVLVAEACGLAVAVEHHQSIGCGCGPVWFVHVARQEPMDELFDLDALIDWYPSALTAAGVAELEPGVVTQLDDLRGRSPAEFLGRTDELIAAPMFDDKDGALHTEAVGLLLGYWPPTSVGFLAGGRRGRREPEYDNRSFWGWDQVRFRLAEERPWLRYGPGEG